jgi:N-acetylglucosaminyldiphosphoundecaprenol N-acetyl-beta-D-mannosaminyltransferase
MNTSSSNPVANVLHLSVDALDMNRALDRTRELLSTRNASYICAAAVHGVVEAQRSAELFAAYQNAALVIPDGMPLVWTGRAQGHSSMERVHGPDFMLNVFGCSAFSEVTHFLYGGNPGVVEELRERLLERFPNARIVGVYTPPFRTLNTAEEEYLEGLFSALKPDIIWVGIGCPKQELFMARYASRWNTKLMVGVGAAFDFHTGRIRDSAPWVKRAGLQWLHRLIQDPKRLWKRYLVTNSIFIFRIALQAVGWTSPRPMPQSSLTRQAESNSR